MCFLTVRPSVHVKDVGDGRRFPGALVVSLFRFLMMFLCFTVCCCVFLIITVGGTAGGGGAAASALFLCPTYSVILLDLVWYTFM